MVYMCFGLLETWFNSFSTKIKWNESKTFNTNVMWMDVMRDVLKLFPVEIKETKRKKWHIILATVALKCSTPISVQLNGKKTNSTIDKTIKIQFCCCAYLKCCIDPKSNTRSSRIAVEMVVVQKYIKLIHRSACRDYTIHSHSHSQTNPHAYMLLFHSNRWTFLFVSKPFWSCVHFWLCCFSTTKTNFFHSVPPSNE